MFFYFIKCNYTYSTHAFYKLSNINIIKPGDLLSVKVVKLRLQQNNLDPFIMNGHLHLCFL